MNLPLLFALTGLFNPTLLKAPDALQFNPAQLALPDRPGFSCRIVDLSLGANSNSLTLGQYNHYTGAYLDEEAKNDILASIPDDGLDVQAQGTASAIEFGYRNFAASIRTVGLGRFVLSEDLLGVALHGNELGQSYQVGGIDGSGKLFLRAGVATATAIGRNWAIGAGGYYLRGLGCTVLREAEADFTVTRDFVAGQGVLDYCKATGGSGLAIDLGVAHWKNNWRFALACLDLSPGIMWTDGIQEAVYSISIDSGTVHEVQSKDLMEYNHDVHPAAEFVTRVPMKLNLGLGRVFSDWLNAAALFQRTFPEFPAGDGGWRMAALAEYQASKWLPVSCVVSYQNPGGVGLGVGVGAVVGRFRFLTRLEYLAGVLAGARGFDFGFGVGYAQPAGVRPEEPLLLRSEPKWY